MTDRTTLKWHTYKYFAYEREFAHREVEALFGTEPSATDEGLVVPSSVVRSELVDRLTYVRAAVNGTGLLGVPTQARLEASTSARHSNGSHGPALRRQQTRYSAHGIHDYRGKYNPQVVRAIGNMFELEAGAWVLDPFCGSGTTLLECAHAGWSCVGVDANPLAVMIANAKVAAIREVTHGLVEEIDGLLHRVRERVGEISHSKPVSRARLDRIAGQGWLQGLPNSDYLTQWFPLPVLAQAAVVLQEIQSIARAPQRLVAQMLLSDILRDVSLQDPRDLRIRRRQDPAANYPVVTLLEDSVPGQLDRVSRARSEVRIGRTSQRALRGDSKRVLGRGRSTMPRVLRRRFNAVITSPPYANALPYIDTQRLSLCLLGLISADEIRDAEARLIGNREITTSERDAGAVEIERNARGLPDSVAELCREMLEASRLPGNGFRRQNTPSLVYRYFSEMSEVFEGLSHRLFPGSPIALVVGHNRTTLGGHRFDIDTPALLGDVACASGLGFSELVRLDAYHRYDLHSRNSIRDEALLLLRA